MKKAYFLLPVVLLACCATNSNDFPPRGSLPQVDAGAYIDFSGYSGTSPLTAHQPPEGTQGPFILDNGITGDGLRVSHIGDRGVPIFIERFGDGMATQSENYTYFFIDNADVRNAATVTMKITFFDDVSGFFRIQYLSTVGSNPNYTDVPVPKSGSNTFITINVQLDDCNFNGDVQNQGAQFRFDHNGALIQRVEVTTGGLPEPTASTPPSFAPATDLNNMIGKVVSGYQLWFNTINWQHWRTNNNSHMPGPGNVHVEMWPAGWEDYLANSADLQDTDFKMPDGSAGRLYNGHDTEVILTHHQWMRDAGIDGSAIQRFFEVTIAADSGDAPNHLTKIRDAAEATDRIFYVMYDMSGAGRSDQNAFVRRIQLDWIYNVENKGLVSSPNYAQADGKPVVCIWGVFSIENADNNRFPHVGVTIELIQWFRDRGYYIIGGIPDNTFWETGGGRHRRSREMYSLFDMISPWWVGRDVNNILSGDNFLSNGLAFTRNNPRSWANNRPIDFMPTIWPGFAWTNMDRTTGQQIPNSVIRNAGQWIWHQIREYLRRDTDNGINSLYLAMFDEYDEATAWMKAGTDFFDIPVDQYFLTHAADGTWLSSDYYLRLAGAMAQAFKNRGPGGSDIGPLNDYGNSNSVIVEHSQGPVFWRNSFERRTGRLKNYNMPNYVPLQNLQIDVGVPNGTVVGTPLNVTVSGAFTVNRPAVARSAVSDNYAPPSTTLGMVYGSARSGDSAFRLAGQRTAGTNALYRYRIANTRIRIESGMRLSYWVQATGLGTNVIVDLLLDNGVYVSDSVSAQNTGSPQGVWQQRTLNIPASLNGSFITAVIIAYRDSGTAAGDFAALIDDIVIGK